MGEIQMRRSFLTFASIAALAALAMTTGASARRDVVIRLLNERVIDANDPAAIKECRAQHGIVGTNKNGQTVCSPQPGAAKVTGLKRTTEVVTQRAAGSASQAGPADSTQSSRLSRAKRDLERQGAENGSEMGVKQGSADARRPKGTLGTLEGRAPTNADTGAK